ncbi:MAG: hypothetical protein GH151_07025, partial [Bacteroidetes bacterium]|nr:hypothetical protein [Bacteroidota bacterium]
MSQNLTFKAVTIDEEGSKSNQTEIKFKEVSELREPEPAGDKSKGIYYQCFKGEWKQLPDISGLEAINSGLVKNISLEPKCFEHGFCLDFDGFINVPEDEVYTFYTESDDGSRLWIGDKLVADNDGIHGVKEKWGQIALKKGFHPVRIRYFEREGVSRFTVFYRIR